MAPVVSYTVHEIKNWSVSNCRSIAMGRALCCRVLPSSKLQAVDDAHSYDCKNVRVKQ